MVTAPHQTYVVVADSAHAHFFDLKEFCKKTETIQSYRANGKSVALERLVANRSGENSEERRTMGRSFNSPSPLRHIIESHLFCCCKQSLLPQ